MLTPRAGAAGPGIDFVDGFAEAATRFVAAVEACDLGAPVPACPGWSTYDVVVHLGNVHSWAATIVETGLRATEPEEHPRRRRTRVVADWYAGRAEDLLRVLAAADPDEECWSFAPGRTWTKAFWPRRQTHETLVHLVDLDQAARRTTDLPLALAEDGVAEVLDVFVPGMHLVGRPADLGGPVGLRVADTGRVWTVTPRGDEPPLVAPEGEGAWPDDVVEAEAAVLLQVLWKRLPPDHPAVHVAGDPDRVLRFLRSPLTP